MQLILDFMYSKRVVRYISALLILVGATVCDRCKEVLDGSHSDFEPIRIHLVYSPGADNPDLQERILPEALNFLQRSVSVRRLKEPLRFPPFCTLSEVPSGKCLKDEAPRCNSIEVPANLISASRDGLQTFKQGPGAFADLVVFVEMGEDDLGSVLARSAPCARDACGRPLSGILTINHSALSTFLIIQTIIHEMLHILAFHHDSFRMFRGPDGLTPRVPQSRKPIFYQCVPNKDHTRYRVHWDVPPKTRDAHIFYFLPEVLTALPVRGLFDCDCPTDPKITYTDAQIEKCMRHPNACAFAIVTSSVVDATRAYYDCPTAEGMEIENAYGIDCGALHQSHWKMRTVYGEIMTATSQDAVVPFVSPMTLALLKDSGWYSVEFSQVSASPVNSIGIFWGYASGCAFLQDPCISNGSLVSGNVVNFCLPKQTIVPQCAPSRLNRVQCIDGSHTLTKKVKTRLDSFSYFDDEYFHGMQNFDFCPAFVPYLGGSCMHANGNLYPSQVFGPDSRCFETRPLNAQNSSPECLLTTCTNSGGYIVSNKAGVSAHCNRDRQTVYLGNKQLNCADPKLICGKWTLPGTGSIAIAPRSNSPSVPPNVVPPNTIAMISPKQRPISRVSTSNKKIVNSKIPSSKNTRPKRMERRKNKSATSFTIHFIVYFAIILIG